jgi:hypothetical protein
VALGAVQHDVETVDEVPGELVAGERLRRLVAAWLLSLTSQCTVGSYHRDLLCTGWVMLVIW